MNTYNFAFYDLVSGALGNVSSHTLQAFVDNYFEKYNALDIKGCHFAPDMEWDYHYDQDIFERGIQVMASIYDVDSTPIPLGPEQAAQLSGKIPVMKDIEYLNRDKMRKAAIAREVSGLNSDADFERLFRKVDSLVGSITNRLSWMRNQMFGKGFIELTSVTNTYGVTPTGVTQKFASHVPAANRVTKSDDARWWTSATRTTANEGANSDPIKDLQDIVQAGSDKGMIGHFEVDRLFFRDILGHSKVIAAIAANIYPTSDVTTRNATAAYLGYDRKRQALEDILGVRIEVNDGLSAVESWDNTNKKLVKTTMRSFPDGVISYVPDGDICEIVAVRPVLVEGGNYGFFYGGRLVLTVGVDYIKQCQSLATEMAALPVPQSPQLMWFLYPCNV